MKLDISTVILSITFLKNSRFSWPLCPFCLIHFLCNFSYLWGLRNTGANTLPDLHYNTDNIKCSISSKLIFLYHLKKLHRKVDNFEVLLKKKYDIQERGCSYRSFHTIQVEYACVKINFFSTLSTRFRGKLKTKSPLFHCTPLEIRIVWMMGEVICYLSLKPLS